MLLEQEDVAVIAEICEAARSCAPGYDAQVVFENWKKRKAE